MRVHKCVCVACVALGGRQIVEASKLVAFLRVIAIRVFKQEDKRAAGVLEKGPFLAAHTP